MVRSLSIVAVTALLVIVLTVGAFFAALARGPIASDWLAPKIVEALDDLYVHRYQFGLSSVAIASTDHGLTFTVNGLAVKSGERTILAAPRAQLSVDPRALLIGRLTPRRLDVLDLELRLEVLPDGVVAISAPGADPVAIPLDAPSPAARRRGAGGACRPLAAAGGGRLARGDEFHRRSREPRRRHRQDRRLQRPPRDRRSHAGEDDRL
ncbi:hypothetical protein [Methylosinus sporium]|uniref:hypothetical protein n=1 Tax=Methylosinus sporium TaxID=428 RepID=UPI00383BC0C2